MAICIRSGQVSEDEIDKLWEGKLYIGHSTIHLIRHWLGVGKK